MIKLFGKIYAGLVTILAIIVLIAAPAFGFFCGKYGYVSEYVTFPANLSDTVCGIIVAAVTFIVTFLCEALVFGFEAQIILIRKKVEKIEKKMD